MDMFRGLLLFTLTLVDSRTVAHGPAQGRATAAAQTIGVGMPKWAMESVAQASAAQKAVGRGIPTSTRRFIGAALGLGASAGDVFGAQGKQCKPASYAGWFLEGGLSAGPFSAGLDVGFNEDGPPIPFTDHRLPGSGSGVSEFGFGVGGGAMGKLTYCYYTLIGGQ
jgi:hypothetical protein